MSVFVHSSMHHFKLSQRSIITKQPSLSAEYHWWIVKGNDDQNTNETIRAQTARPHGLSLRRGRAAVSAAFSPHCDLSLQVCDRMSSLKEVCSGLPLDPLPANRGRDPSVPHAPLRTPNLTAEEERVSQYADSSVQ